MELVNTPHLIERIHICTQIRIQRSVRTNWGPRRLLKGKLPTKIHTKKFSVIITGMDTKPMSFEKLISVL